MTDRDRMAEVMKERRRQRSKGYDRGHDAASHDDGALAAAAAFLAWPSTFTTTGAPLIPCPGWARTILVKHRDRHRQLVIATALLFAEMERLSDGDDDGDNDDGDGLLSEADDFEYDGVPGVGFDLGDDVAYDGDLQENVVEARAIAQHLLECAVGGREIGDLPDWLHDPRNSPFPDLPRSGALAEREAIAGWLAARGQWHHAVDILKGAHLAEVDTDALDRVMKKAGKVMSDQGMAVFHERCKAIRWLRNQGLDDYAEGLISGQHEGY